jgi:putative ABC transport system permease protein
VIVNQSAEHKLFPGSGAVGRLVTTGSQTKEVIGVVQDAHYRTIAERLEPQLFFPLLEGQGTVVGEMSLLARAADPEAALPQIRAQLENFDKELPVSDARTYDTLLADVLMPQRFGITLLGFFSCAGVVLSAIGIYGAVSYSVKQRYQEIGIRMALGAAQSDVLQMCLRSGALPALFGVFVGLAAAGAATRLLSAFLFGVSPTDTTTFAVTAILLFIVSAAASYLPARKATRIERAVALRHN